MAKSYHLSSNHYLAVSYAQDVAGFQAAAVQAAHALGFERVSAFIALDRPSGTTDFLLTAANTPPGFSMICDDPVRGSRGRADPVMQTMKRDNRPFAWDYEFYRRRGRTHQWDDLVPFHYKSGIASALHLPNGRHHAFGVTREEPLPADEDRLQQLMAQVYLLGCYAHEAASRVFSILPPSDISLTDREMECLRWTLAGKTAWEVGHILHLSERTVGAVLSHATKKLDCVSKHQARCARFSLD